MIVPCLIGGAGLIAAGIAPINAAGNISGYLAPQLVGLLRDLTGDYAIPMLVMGGLVFVAGPLVPLADHARTEASAPDFAVVEGEAPHLHP